jgi:hypothetical protein
MRAEPGTLINNLGRRKANGLNHLGRNGQNSILMEFSFAVDKWAGRVALK